MEENQVITEQKAFMERLPNATATLVLGILSIVSCWCYAVPGTIMAVIALIISNSSMKMYRANPSAYFDFGNLKAGRICAIIGLCLNGVWLLVILYMLIFIGSAIGFSEFMNQCQGY